MATRYTIVFGLLVVALFAAAQAAKVPCGCSKRCTTGGVCGKDGRAYCNKCAAECAGTTVAGPGPVCPSRCTDFQNPVCGNDNVTYANPCEAYHADTSVQYLGACPPDTGDVICIAVVDPVCDPTTNITYSNDCVARAAGAKEIVDGECPGPCFCNYLVYQPTCGADGHTYGASCELFCAGTTYAHEGACTARDCGCTNVSHPVCGTDKKTYRNLCQLLCFGGELARTGKC